VKSPDAERRAPSSKTRFSSNETRAKADQAKGIRYVDEGNPSKMKSNELAVNPDLTASPPPPPHLPKDGNAEDMQETIKLLQLKVEKMTQLLELKSEKLEKLESNSSLPSLLRK
jgi:hypothetical protein